MNALPTRVLALCVAAGAVQAASQYSPLEQINRGNVADLELAWTYRTGEIERRGPALAAIQSFEDTPRIIDGALIVCTPLSRIIALDPETGTERWVFDPNTVARPVHAVGPKCRGVADWVDPRAGEDAPCRHRIVFGTWDFRVWAIDARSGRRCAGFGDGGRVDLDPGKPLMLEREIELGTPPAVIGDVAVFGSMLVDGVRQAAPSGKVRALDLRSGALRWEFDPIPRDPDDPAAATWHAGSARTAGNANVWAPPAVDAERDLVFLPTSTPSPDFYGGLRPGENRYANSLVALRGSTGELVWHFQVSHHDLWDYDLPAQPILIDLPVGDAMVPAVVQLTKQGLVFVFHRETGEPLFPVKERPVPQGGVDGEWVSPTQPFPTAPPPLVAQGIAPEDAWGFTPIDRWFCRRKIARFRYGPIYTPPSLQGTVVLPSPAGGPNWGGGAYDPRRHLLVVPTMHIAFVVRLKPRTATDPQWRETYETARADRDQVMPQFGTPYQAEFEMLDSPIGAPCTAPPWGRLSGVDLVHGTLRWQVPLGSLEKLLPVPLPLALGTPNAGGPIATAGGLVFIGASLDDKFRAFDTDTGAILWEAELPAGAQATPTTYLAGGRQYVVIAAGGHGFLGGTRGDYVLAFALPRGG